MEWGSVGDDRDGCRLSVMMIVQQLEEEGAMELWKWELKKKVWAETGVCTHYPPAYTTTVPGRQVQAAPALAYFHIPEYSLLNTLNFTGIKQGEISPTSVNSEFLATLAEMEDMKATFVGHDHVNDFCGNVHCKNLAVHESSLESPWIPSASPLHKIQWVVSSDGDLQLLWWWCCWASLTTVGLLDSCRGEALLCWRIWVSCKRTCWLVQKNKSGCCHSQERSQGELAGC